MVQSKQEQYLQGEGARMTQAELFSRMLAAPALAHLQADGLLSVHQGLFITTTNIYLRIFTTFLERRDEHEELWNHESRQHHCFLRLIWQK